MSALVDSRSYGAHLEVRASTSSLVLADIYGKILAKDTSSSSAIIDESQSGANTKLRLRPRKGSTCFVYTYCCFFYTSEVPSLQVLNVRSVKDGLCMMEVVGRFGKGDIYNSLMHEDGLLGNAGRRSSSRLPSRADCHE